MCVFSFRPMRKCIYTRIHVFLIYIYKCGLSVSASSLQLVLVWCGYNVIDIVATGPALGQLWIESHV